jgi:DNA (cytosine-5)-methyltransferase 1
MKFLKTSTTDELEKWRKHLTCISLFSGCGGAALGIRKAGFEIRVFVEWDKHACSTLRTNWTREGWQGHPIKQMNPNDGAYGCEYWHQEREPAIMQVDITQTSTQEILKSAGLEVGEATLLEGGFPCQGFSMAGARVIDDPRNKLYKEAVRVISEAMPKSIMLENVPGITSMANGEVMLQVCRDIAGAGYNVGWDILNAADYGVPQNRHRVFFIGNRVDALVMTDPRPKFHMGFCPGSITFPMKWINQHKKKNPNIAALLTVHGARKYMDEAREVEMFIVPANLPDEIKDSIALGEIEIKKSEQLSFNL